MNSTSDKFVTLYNGCKTPKNKFGYFPMFFNLATKFKQVTVEGQLLSVVRKGVAPALSKVKTLVRSHRKQRDSTSVCIIATRNGIPSQRLL